MSRNIDLFVQFSSALICDIKNVSIEKQRERERGDEIKEDSE